MLKTFLSLCSMALIAMTSIMSGAYAQEQFDLPVQILDIQEGPTVFGPPTQESPFDAAKQEKDDAKDAKKDAKKKQDDKKKKADEPLRKVQERKPVNPKQVVFHLWDGNVITGDLSTDGVSVQTEFGELTIPVEKLYGFRPGLNSFPELQNKIKEQITKLGDKDFNVRETAHKAIVAMGPQFLMEIYRYEDGGNAERKRHLKEIRAELETLAEDMEDDEASENGDIAMLRGDSVKTKDFTIVGKIKQSTFVVKSKYGPLNVKLADIKYMDRPLTGGGEVRKTIRIPGNTMLGKNMKSTGIRVEKGDVLTIRASGQITMTPWGSSRRTGPDGSSSYSRKSGFNGGSLVMQVGNGKAVYLGSKKTLKFTSSGTLKLGVAIPDSYMNYSYPGEYKVVVKVESK